MPVLPAWLTATLASDAAQGRGVVQPGLRPLDPASRLAAPALVAWRVAWAALATVSGVLGAHMPSSNTELVCGLPIANTVAAVPVALNDVEM